MVNYENGKIYKIVCNVTGLCYIGSTAQKYISDRVSSHKRSYKKYLAGLYDYVTSFKILENDNYFYEIVETYPCNNKYELEKKERYYIEKMECVNKIIPTRTNKEYYENNKKVIAIKQKIYQEKNKHKIQQYKKQWREQNKERKKEINRLYYEVNKDKIKEKQNKKYTCECGKIYTFQNKARHFKSKKHQSYLSSIELKEI